jgi:alpha-glucosidase
VHDPAGDQPVDQPVDQAWWRSAVVYQVYPRSFADSNGDGVGDLAGIRSRLAYLADLGVDAVWLSPFFPSPMADFGYDVSDYCGVDPLFGTLADFDALVATAHDLGLRVLIDWVPNHTSAQHPWFQSALRSRDDPKRDWYVWHDPALGGGPPNNWTAAFIGGPAWTFDEASGQYYLHLFLPQQPDLNWRNPEVVEAMEGVLRFWLDRGVDGFRMDVIHALVKRADFGDVAEPGWQEMIDESRFDPPAVHALLRRFRRLLDSYPGDRTSVGEVFILSTAKVAEYYGENDELHLAFNFPPLFAAWDAGVWRQRIDRTEEELDPRGAWPTWVLSNHDNPRHRTRYGSEARARAAAVLLLTLRGTTFLFEGEELGLEDAVVPPARKVDPGGRDGCRAPVPWTVHPPHGWAGAEPWLPFPPSPGAHSAEAEAAEPASMLHLYKRLLAARRASPALQLGSWAPLPSPEGVLAYERVLGADRRVVLVNYTDAEHVVAVSGEVEVSSIGRDEGTPFTGTLVPDEAVILGPDQPPRSQGSEQRNPLL